jgi:hypothetical protein
MRCANCGFALEHHDERASMPGCCDGCGEQVCYQCGCTDEHPCVREDGLTCSWMFRALSGWIELETCDFCLWRLGAEAYAAAQRQQVLVL